MGNNLSGKRIFVRFGLALMFWGVISAPLSAQTVGGTILGIVQDQQGGAIGKARLGYWDVRQFGLASCAKASF